MNPFNPVTIRSQVPIPLESAPDARFFTFDGLPAHAEHFAVVFGEPASEAPLVRVHSECITGDAFGSLRCDCGSQLKQAIEMMQPAGGILLYLRQEGRGIGLVAKLDAYRLQHEQGLDTYAANEAISLPADAREYDCAAQMLRAMGVASIQLITNNPDKVIQLTKLGINVIACVSAGTHRTEFNVPYLTAKAQITGHALQM
jgi:GTP cyclohydrolase II